MAGVTEVAPDVYRISVYATWANLQFNHFLVNDDEPLLFHTGLRGMFPDVREAVEDTILNRTPKATENLLAIAPMTLWPQL